MKFQKWHLLSSRIFSDTSVLAHVIQSFGQVRELQKGKQLHVQLICTGYLPSTFITNHLLNMYARCGQLDYSIHLFNEVPQRNLITWTAMISAFSQNKKFLKALEVFLQMRVCGENPTQFAFSSAIQATTSLGWLEFGKQLHSLSVKSGFDFELYVGSNLGDMYFKCGNLDDACRVFKELQNKDEVSWTAMIDGYTKSGNLVEALEAFQKMCREGMGVDQYVVCSVLGAYAGLKVVQHGKSFHSCIVKMGFDSDTVVRNALIDMYSKSGDMESASNVFRIELGCFNVISCSSLINGYVEANKLEEALETFLESRRQGIEPNEFTFSSLIKGCASEGMLEQGVQFHAQVIKTGFDKDPFVCSVLIDMYGKSGLVDSSNHIFKEIYHPTDILWNSMVGVYALHGFGKEAMKIFHQMVERGVKPNEIMFINLLTACSHAGLVEEGLDYFASMEKIYGIEPRDEHYSCVIDLLGRAGRLKEAEEFINEMPIKPNAFGWCSFLGACKNYGDKDRGEKAAKKLIELEPGNSGAHVLLSTIYASAGAWEGVKSMRKLMRDNKVKKLPGYSWVDVGNKAHVFGAEDWCHPDKVKIYEKLASLSKQIREAGYVPNTNSVACDMEESLKEKHLQHHSERIALAFALISLPVGKPIIIKKNLRICADCHSAFKVSSKVVERKIIVRDNSRFHHFSDGQCSCRDYW
ncbi:pentatricopeptide repeat-containing protein At3g24000, mitochondrial-like [Aristolochia californica]|uniref:pentatricopeptide repeat-containing protein At3g24000, mitochondrial-like n=1 Tax=Aristolochia californica TaxID=171875 RepID=UPI0035D90E56